MIDTKNFMLRNIFVCSFQELLHRRDLSVDLRLDFSARFIFSAKCVFSARHIGIIPCSSTSENQHTNRQSGSSPLFELHVNNWLTGDLLLGCQEN